MPVKIDVSTVKQIHAYLEQEFTGTSDPISPPGIKSEALLESAVSRQDAGFNGQLKYPDPIGNAATLMYGLCNNHPFHNGNKRTALLAGILHLDLNGYVLHKANNDQLYETMIKVASHAMVEGDYQKKNLRGQARLDAEVSALDSWLSSKTRKIQVGERPITYGRLYEILQGFEYRMGNKKHNKVEVLKETSLIGLVRWKCIYKLPCPGDSKNVPFNEIKQVRNALKLTEEYGVDSVTFYGEQTLIDGHIREYRSVLRRLAKT